MEGLGVKDESLAKIKNIFLVFTVLCSIVIVVCTIGLLFGWENPSEEEAEVAVEKYVKIKLADGYTLDAMEYEYTKNNGRFVISYLGTNETTGKKKEVIEKEVSYTEIEETISKDKMKQTLEKKAEKNKQ